MRRQNGKSRCFLEDERRMNVAISRAKVTLDVVCNPELPRRLAPIQALKDAARLVVSQPTQAAMRGVCVSARFLSTRLRTFKQCCKCVHSMLVLRMTIRGATIYQKHTNTRAW